MRAGSELKCALESVARVCTFCLCAVDSTAAERLLRVVLGERDWVDQWELELIV